MILHEWCSLFSKFVTMFVITMARAIPCDTGSRIIESWLHLVINRSWHSTHWGRVTHICVGNLTIGPDNGLSPGRRQAIVWTNAGILLSGPWGTNFSEILIDINTFSFKKINLKRSSVKWPQCVNTESLAISREISSASLTKWCMVCWMPSI